MQNSNVQVFLDELPDGPKWHYCVLCPKYKHKQSLEGPTVAERCERYFMPEELLDMDYTPYLWKMESRCYHHPSRNCGFAGKTFLHPLCYMPPNVLPCDYCLPELAIIIHPRRLTATLLEIHHKLEDDGGANKFSARLLSFLPEYYRYQARRELIDSLPLGEQKHVCLRCYDGIPGNRCSHLFAREQRRVILEWKQQMRTDWYIGKHDVYLSDDFIWEMLGSSCYYCGKAGYGGIDRVDSSMRDYVVGNCISCCRTCNIIKSDSELLEFYHDIRAIANHQGLIHDPHALAQGVRRGGSSALWVWKGGAIRRNLEISISDEEYDKLRAQSCYLCGVASLDLSNGVDRIDSALGYTSANSRPCCSICNWRKVDLSFDDFMAKVKEIVEYFDLDRMQALPFILAEQVS